jgi:hypothetical protein
MVGRLNRVAASVQFAHENAATNVLPAKMAIPAYRITFNKRLDLKERFVTIAHELGHIFCGHLGACVSGSRDRDESGWRDRRSLPTHQKEVEAESVAFLVASRAGAVDISRIDLELIVRAAARIERLAKIHHGSMRFGAAA